MVEISVHFYVRCKVCTYAPVVFIEEHCLLILIFGVSYRSPQGKNEMVHLYHIDRFALCSNMTVVAVTPPLFSLLALFLSVQLSPEW